MIIQENQWNEPFQGKNLEKISPIYHQGKQIHYKRIEVFTIRFNSKYIVISCSNLLTRPRASSKFTDSFSSWIYTNSSRLACNFEIPLKSFRSPSVMILMQQLCSTKRLIVVLTLLDSYVVRKYKTSQISQRVTHKSFQ